jgi:hypothetical protein
MGEGVYGTQRVMVRTPVLKSPNEEDNSTSYRRVPWICVHIFFLSFVIQWLMF